MKTLFLNPYSGIAGDMFVAALLDLGVDQEAFDQAMRSLPLPAEEWSYDVESVVKSGVKSTKFNVHFQEKASHHHGRHLSEIIRIIEASALSERAQTNAKAIFQLLAEAEAEVHGTTIEKVHFHEVGAVDAIADICGAAICMDLLDIEGLVSSPPALGSGTVNCDHGTMPVPVPAVSNLLREVPVKACSIPFELTTPTGAAILKHFAKAFEASPEGKIIESGYGAGNRELESQANVLPVLLLEAGNEATERVTVIECNLDAQNFSLKGRWIMQSSPVR